MPLSTERRTQLDSIVANLASQNAPKEDVQAIVNDFVGKYGEEQAPAAKPQTFAEKHPIIAGAGELAKGAARSVASSIGRTVTQGLDTSLGQPVNGPISRLLPENVKVPGLGEVGLRYAGQEAPVRALGQVGEDALNAVTAGPSMAKTAARGVLTKVAEAAPRALPLVSKIATAGKFLLPRAVEQGGIGAGYQVSSNLKEGRPVMENVGTTAAIAAAIPFAGAGLSSAKSAAAEGVSRAFPKGAAAISKAKDLVYETLRPAQGEIRKLEVRQGKSIRDIAGVLARDKELPKVDTNNKLDWTEVIKSQGKKVTAEHDQVNRILEGLPETATVDFETVRSRIYQRLEETFKNATELKDAKKLADELIDDEVERYGKPLEGLDAMNQLGIDLFEGKKALSRKDPTIHVRQANDVKSGLWSVGYVADKPMRSKVARLLGHELNDEISAVAKSSEVARLNKSQGERLDAMTLMTNSHGRVVKGGRLGNYILGGVGAAVLAPIPYVGPVAGYFAGKKAGEVLNKLRPVFEMKRAGKLMQAGLAQEEKEKVATLLAGMSPAERKQLLTKVPIIKNILGRIFGEAEGNHMISPEPGSGVGPFGPEVKPVVPPIVRDNPPMLKAIPAVLKLEKGKALGPGHQKWHSWIDKLAANKALHPEEAQLLKKVFENTDDTFLGKVETRMLPRNLNRGVPGETTVMYKASGVGPSRVVQKVRAGINDWTLQNKGPHGVFLHEFGHVGWDALLDDAERSHVGNAYARMERSGELKKYLTELGYSETGVKYYAKNRAEFFAEAFSHYVQTKEAPKEFLSLFQKLFAHIRVQLSKILSTATPKEIESLSPFFESVIRGTKSTGKSEFGDASNFGLTNVREPLSPSSVVKKVSSELPASKSFFRGGGLGSMPRGKTARDVIDYETKELGNSLKVEKGIDLDKISSDSLHWVTETKSAAKQYGSPEPANIGNHRVVARDGFGGVLVEKVSGELPIAAGDLKNHPVYKNFSQNVLTGRSTASPLINAMDRSRFAWRAAQDARLLVESAQDSDAAFRAIHGKTREEIMKSMGENMQKYDSQSQLAVPAAAKKQTESVLDFVRKVQETLPHKVVSNDLAANTAGKIPYSQAPDPLMGYSKEGNVQKGFGQHPGYKTTVKVKVTFPDGTVHFDEIQGLNRVHAMERARRNWVNATVEAR